MPEGLRPLLVTDDSELLDDVLRLAAAADVEVDVAHAAAHARRSWATAPLVLVGRDKAVEMARAKPHRRDDVLLLGSDPDDTEVWQHAVSLGVENVVHLPGSESWLVDRMADAAEGDEQQAVTVCVLGGRGGAGASTLAAALALTGSRNGLRTLLIDGDPLGGGLDLVLGSEDVSGSRWSDFVGTRGRVSGPALRSALPGLASCLSCPGGLRTPMMPPGEGRAVSLAVVPAVSRAVSLAVSRAPCRATFPLGRCVLCSALGGGEAISWSSTCRAVSTRPPRRRCRPVRQRCCWCQRRFERQSLPRGWRRKPPSTPPSCASSFVDRLPRVCPPM